MGNDTPVLIVGAGPVGLTLALVLRQAGCAVRIVDRRPEPSRHSKAMTLQPRSLELLAPFGLATSMVAAGVPVARATIYGGRRRLAQLNYGLLPSPFPFLLQLPQHEIERQLIAALATQGVVVERQVTLRDLDQGDRGVRATLEDDRGGRTVACAPYLIGCDGASSTVLDLLGIPSTIADYEANFIMADVRIPDFPLARDERHTFVSPGRYTVFLPIGAGIYRLITLRPAATPNQGLPPTLDEFAALLAESRAPRMALAQAEWLTQFQPRRRLATAFQRGRVFLAGDAAHIHSPVGAQGLNTGLQDAVNLGWKLALVLRGQAHDALLQTYERERLPAACAVIEQTDSLYRQIAATGRWEGLRARNRWYLYRWPPLHRRQIATTAQLAGGYRSDGDSTIEVDDASVFRKQPAVGSRAPDFADSQTGARFLSAIDGRRYQLLLFPGAHAPNTAALAEMTASVRLHYPDQIRVHAIVRQPAGGGVTVREWADAHGQIHKRYGVRKDGLFLIRPDGHIACRLRFAREPLARYLATVLTSRACSK